MSEAIYKFIDLFAGIGGFRIAMERLGHQCVWSCENDKFAKRIYRYHWEEPADDIRGIDAAEVPDHDILCAGFPCQDFSIAGRREGIKGDRGNLFYEITRVAEAKRPSYLFLENVEGLLTSNRGWDFATIQIELDELGYEFQWQVHNTKNFGLPQNRPRVFIVGHLRGKPRPEVFPLREDEKVSNGKTSTERGSSQAPITGAITGKYRAHSSYVLSNIYGGYGEEHSRVSDISPTIRTPKGGGHLPVLAIIDDFNETIKDEVVTGAVRETFGRQSPKNACKLYIQTVPHGRNPGWTKDLPLIKSHRGSPYNELLVDGIKIRRFTPLECERLQGFPDGWTEWGIDEKGNKVQMSDHQRYRALGNAVTVDVVEEIAKEIP